MKKGIVNGVLKLVLGIVKLFNLKLAVVLDQHKIKLKSVEPDDKEQERYFDADHYINGNIYIRDKSNPVKPDKSDDDVTLISSRKYKDFFKMDIIESIARISEGALEVKGWKIMIITNILTLMGVIFLFMLMMGGA